MSSFNNIFSKFGRKGRGGANRFKPRPMRPGRDWLFGIFFFTVIVACGSVASGLMFMRYSSTTIESASTDITMPRYNQKQVDDALTKFKGRTATFKHILSTGAPLPTEPVAPATTTAPVSLPTPEPEPTPAVEGAMQVE